MGAHRLLVSDLDGTLLGDDESLGSFRDWLTRERTGWRVVYATGRTIDSVAGLIRDGILVEPDAIVSRVGTEIHRPDGDAWPGWPTWDARWPIDAVRALMAGRVGIRPQVVANQSPWKASYHAPDLSGDAVEGVRRALADAGIDATVIYSSARDLDVLPPGAGKAAAAHALAGHWSIPDGDVIAAGDTGNDLDLLTAGFRGIVVANAQPELQRLRDPRVFHAERPFAAGVLEGIAHWSAVMSTSVRA